MMKTLKLIRLISIIAALGILAAYTIVYIFQGEYQMFNCIILLSCLVLVPLLIITEFQKEKLPNLLIRHDKKRRNIMLCLCAIMLAIGLYDMIAFDKGWKGLPFILIVIYIASTSWIRYNIRQQYMEVNHGVDSSDHKTDDLVAVAKYNDPVKAHITKGVLETNGIEAVIFGDGLQQTIGAGAHIFPVSVMVKNSDKDAAEKLINEEPID